MSGWEKLEGWLVGDRREAIWLERFNGCTKMTQPLKSALQIEHLLESLIVLIGHFVGPLAQLRIAGPPQQHLALGKDKLYGFSVGEAQKLSEW